MKVVVTRDSNLVKKPNQLLFRKLYPKTRVDNQVLGKYTIPKCCNNSLKVSLNCGCIGSQNRKFPSYNKS